MNSILSLQDAIENAKNFENFQGVLMTVSLHPEWLTEIPEGRKWAVLHHIVYSGNINHLDQLLALQKSNQDFRLLVKTSTKETILDVATLRDDKTEMLKRIERLIKLDEMLNYAKDCDWDECYDIVKENPSYGNEKPPYRRFYLIHHLACANEIDQFERFKKIKNFKFDLTLRADRKKINVIAREEGYAEFADYIEKEYSSFFDDDEIDDQLYEPSEEAKTHTNNINILMEQRNVFLESDLFLSPAENIVTRAQTDKYVRQKLGKQKQASSASKPVIEHPLDVIRSLLTCSLTQAIVTDPVVAADGFTYERTAIENWLKTNDCSPMTNEKLAHKNLNPNLIVKQILISITQE